MTVSKLATGSLPHHGKHSARGSVAVSRVIVHHWAGTSGGDVSLASPGRDASANYVLYSDGTLKSQVPEEFRAWTSGGQAIDAPSITVEVQNSTNGPDWRVSDAAIAKLTELVADIARRYGWGGVSADRVRGHREFAATACPGPYLFPRLGAIATNAHKLTTNTTTVTPTAGQEEDEDMEPQFIAGKKRGTKGPIYQLTSAGRKRRVGSPEWSIRRTIEGETKVPLNVVLVDDSDLNAIPNA